jgi:glutamine amidotransferase
MIGIIDYGMGNLRSVQKAFEAAGYQAIVTRDDRELDNASHLVLPGVGAFGDCMANLDRYGLIEPIHRGIARGKPFLGICLGLQLLFTESHEFGVHKGLDVVAGTVKRFPVDSNPDRGRLKVPHMGWNAVDIRRPAPPLAGLETGAHMYFVHSYYVEPRDESIVATMTDYGVPFVSSVWRDNVFACQFHPEKSQAVGLQIIRNFGAWQ